MHERIGEFKMNFKVKSTNDTIKFFFLNWLFKLVSKKPGTNVHVYYSETYGIHFDSFKEYWMEIGRRNALVEVITHSKSSHIKGISLEELLQKVSTYEFGTGPGVIIYNVDTQNIGRTLDRFKGVETSVFMEDFVFISVDSRQKAIKIIDKIPPAMADCIAIEAGFIFYRNT